MRRNTGAVLSGQALSELLSPEAVGLRWFVLPAEAQMMHKGQLPSARSPFIPPPFLQAVPVANGNGHAHEHEEGVARPLGATANGNGHHQNGSSGNGTKVLTGKKAKKAAKNAEGGWVEPDKKLSNKVLRAVLQHGMLRPGDRVLLGLSGGKDSLCLLHVLHNLQKRTPFQWEHAACTVDPNADGH